MEAGVRICHLVLSCQTTSSPHIPLYCRSLFHDPWPRLEWDSCLLLFCCPSCRPFSTPSSRFWYVKEPRSGFSFVKLPRVCSSTHGKDKLRQKHQSLETFIMKNVVSTMSLCFCEAHRSVSCNSCHACKVRQPVNTLLVSQYRGMPLVTHMMRG